MRRLVEDQCGWHEPCEWRNEVERTLRQPSALPVTNAREIALPPARPIISRLRCDKARKERTRGMMRDEAHDLRQNPIHPGRGPQAAACENILHVDAKMHRAGYSFGGGSSCHGRGVLAGGRRFSRGGHPVFQTVFGDLFRQAPQRFGRMVAGTKWRLRKVAAGHCKSLFTSNYELRRSFLAPGGVALHKGTARGMRQNAAADRCLAMRWRDGSLRI
jgi:hypothetical protein